MAIDKKLKAEMEKNLDPYEISRLHQMAEAAKMMDLNDKKGAMVKEGKNGNK